jgi:hypothetical protein
LRVVPVVAEAAPRDKAVLHARIGAPELDCVRVDAVTRRFPPIG